MNSDSPHPREKNIMPLDDLLARLFAQHDSRDVAPCVAIVVAHPDDETIGASSLLPRLREVTIIHTPDGAPHDMEDACLAGFTTREAYARARRQELYQALALAGIESSQTRTLSFVDKEASHALVSLTRQLTNLLRERQVEVVLTHPYEGGHPDHDATAFAVHAACQVLARNGEQSPVIIEMTSYHESEGDTHRGLFLPHAGGEETIVTLTPEQQAQKKRMFAAYATQKRVLIDFAIKDERFRLAPHYNFTRPPHAGRLNYEAYNWGWTGERWRELARQALVELKLEN